MLGSLGLFREAEPDRVSVKAKIKVKVAEALSTFGEEVAVKVLLNTNRGHG